MARKRQAQPVTDEELALFREAIDGVRPLSQDKTPPFRDPPPPVPQQRIEDERRVVDDMFSDWDPAELETGDELWFARAGLQHTVLRKLRRGQYSVGAKLDLHGHTVAEARPMLAHFLLESRRRDLRCVRIIHGKGLGSRRQQPVLKAKVNHWLQQREEVLAFCSARPVDGGTGALYVLLKRLSGR